MYDARSLYVRIRIEMSYRGRDRQTNGLLSKFELSRPEPDSGPRCPGIYALMQTLRSAVAVIWCFFAEMCDDYGQPSRAWS
jgi:hypothetical protein